MVGEDSVHQTPFNFEIAATIIATTNVAGCNVDTSMLTEDLNSAFSNYNLAIHFLDREARSGIHTGLFGAYSDSSTSWSVTESKKAATRLLVASQKWSKALAEINGDPWLSGSVQRAASQTFYANSLADDESQINDAKDLRPGHRVGHLDIGFVAYLVSVIERAADTAINELEMLKSGSSPGIRIGIPSDKEDSLESITEWIEGPSVESWFIGHKLPEVYEKHFRRKFGVSRPPDGKGKPFGPGIRFISCVLKHLGMEKSPEAIVKIVSRRKHGTPSEHKNNIDVPF